MKIDNGIPIPPTCRVYPWGEMEVGDSVLFDNGLPGMAARKWGRKHNKKFVGRKTDEGYRIWRTE